MKILVVSLLRLGDLIQQGELLRSLRAQHPQAEIHVLINRQFSQIAKILEGCVDQFIHFEREAIQKGLGEAEYNILWSYQVVADLVDRLSAEKYDVIYNFTHNRLSGYLIGAIQCPEKRGLYHQDGQFQGLANRWLRYFNDRFSGTQKSLFHYLEILGNAYGIPVEKRRFEVEPQRRRNKLILLQCLTSDEKKNWGLEQFAQLKRVIEISLVDYEVCILGASFEQEKLLQYFKAGELLICDLSEAQKHLRNCSLLVTGDTSIKHMAAQLGTPIVEIAIGSSDASKTAAFSNQAVILKSDIPCAPCSHSQACPQKSHLCADNISVEKVFESVWNQLSSEKINQVNLLNEFERAVWTVYLNQQAKGDEMVDKQLLETLLPGTSLADQQSALSAWILATQHIQNFFSRISAALPARESLVAKRNFHTSDVAELILCAQDILKDKTDSAGYFQPFVEALTAKFTQPVQIYDRVQSSLVDIEELLEIRETLTRQIKAFSMEGVFYAKGIGQLSISGFEEAGKSLQRNPQNTGLQSRSREDATP